MSTARQVRAWEPPTCWARCLRWSVASSRSISRSVLPAGRGRGIGCPPCLLAQVSPADAAMLSMAVDNKAGHGETATATATEAELMEATATETELIEAGPPTSLLPKMIKKARSSSA